MTERRIEYRDVGLPFQVGYCSACNLPVDVLSGEDVCRCESDPLSTERPWINWDTDVGLVDTQASVNLMTVRIEQPTKRHRRLGRSEDRPLPRGLLIDAMTVEQRAELRRLRWELKCLGYISALSRLTLRERQNDRFERVYRKRAKREARLANRAYLSFLRSYVESKGGSWA